MQKLRRDCSDCDHEVSSPRAKSDCETTWPLGLASSFGSAVIQREGTAECADNVANRGYTREAGGNKSCLSSPHSVSGQPDKEATAWPVRHTSTQTKRVSRVTAGPESCPGTRVRVKPRHRHLPQVDQRWIWRVYCGGWTSATKKDVPRKRNATKKEEPRKRNVRRNAETRTLRGWICCCSASSKPPLPPTQRALQRVPRDAVNKLQTPPPNLVRPTPLNSTSMCHYVTFWNGVENLMITQRSPTSPPSQ